MSSLLSQKEDVLAVSKWNVFKIVFNSFHTNNEFATFRSSTNNSNL